MEIERIVCSYLDGKLLKMQGVPQKSKYVWVSYSNFSIQGTYTVNRVQLSNEKLQPNSSYYVGTDEEIVCSAFTEEEMINLLPKWAPSLLGFNEMEKKWGYHDLRYGKIDTLETDNNKVLILADLFDDLLTWVGNGVLKPDNYKKLLLASYPTGKFSPMKQQKICKKCKGRGITFQWHSNITSTIGVGRIFPDGHMETGWDESISCVDCNGKGYLKEE